MSIEECRLFELPVKDGPQGNLAVAEGDREVPFQIARAFFVYDIPQGATRGGHAHRTLKQAVFCVTGAVELTVEDLEGSRTFRLDSPSQGLYLPPMVWLRIEGFAPGTAYVVLASARFEENEYIRDYDEYQAIAEAAGAR